MKEIKKIIWNYKMLGGLFYASLFSSMMVWVWMIFLPKITEKIVFVLDKNLWQEELFYWAGFWVVILLWIAVSWYISDILEEKIWETIYCTKSQKVRGKLLEKNYKDIMDVWTGQLISRVTRWVWAEAEIFLALYQIGAVGIFRMVLSLIFLLYYVPQLFIVVLICSVILFALNYLFKKKIAELSKKENVLFEQSDRVFVRIINENLIIKLFNKSQNELKKSSDILTQIPKIVTKRTGMQSLTYVTLYLCLKWLEIFIYVYIGIQVLEGGADISRLILIVGLIWTMWYPFEKMSWEINRITKHFQAFKKMDDFLSIEDDIINWSKAYIYKQGLIEFKNVNFWYSKDIEVFKNLNLQLLSWRKNALIWNSWWWKSTIMKLLLRLYDIDWWQILIDWQDVKNLDIDSLYREVWYLSQEPSMFDGTIRENMEYAFAEESIESESIYVPEEKEALIWNALEKSQVADLVKKLDKWLDTEIWEKWIKLSGWEKQRLAIARIFLKNPKIIILDEPTSALDNTTEKHIQESLDELMQWKTSIIIAHRLSTIKNADKIFMLEDWEVIESWGYSELMESEWKFYELASPEHLVVS